MSYARTLVKLSSFQIVSGADTIPYSSENVPYATDATAGTTVKAALDAIFAVLYPNTKQAVDFYSDLPVVGNDLHDYRIVLDDGDGKAAGYRWEKREGEVVASWHKVHDMDWSNDSILAALQDQALDLYVSKYGREDLDVDGIPLSGLFAGQNIYGGTSPGSSITFHANAGDPTDEPEDQTGYIQFNGNARPVYDDAYELGSPTNRFSNIYFSGDLSDGVTSLSIEELFDAYTHAVTASGNPHGTSYDDLAAKLGTLTLGGDATGSVDLSASGAHTLTVAIANDSHTHDAATSITGLDSGVYDYLKAALIDNANVTWVFDDVDETIEAEVTIDALDSLESPLVDMILTASPDGTTWRRSQGLIELTGDAIGSATYDSTADKWEIATTVSGSSIEGLSGVSLTNKTFISSAGDPTILLAPAHGMVTGEKATFYGTLLTGTQTITRIDANSLSVPVATGASDTGHYIPTGGQLLWDANTQLFKIAKEYEQIKLGELAGLDEDVLSIYVAKDGRTGGQTVKGGISAGESLKLESTANATKGFIFLADDTAPFADASYSGGWSGTDLGTSSLRFNDLYMAGEAKGLRVEAVGALPSSSGTAGGRLVKFNSKLYMDTGSAWIQAGSSDLSVVTKFANYTVITEDVILADATTAARTITLPSAVGYTKQIKVKKIDSTTNAIIIAAAGGATIDGASTYEIVDQYLSVGLVSDGTNWHII